MRIYLGNAPTDMVIVWTTFGASKRRACRVARLAPGYSRDEGLWGRAGVRAGRDEGMGSRAAGRRGWGIRERAEGRCVGWSGVPGDSTSSCPQSCVPCFLVPFSAPCCLVPCSVLCYLLPCSVPCCLVPCSALCCLVPCSVLCCLVPGSVLCCLVPGSDCSPRHLHPMPVLLL